MRTKILCMHFEKVERNITTFNSLNWLVFCNDWYIFSSKHNLHKRSYDLYFWTWRPFDWYILLKSIDQKVWSPKTKAAQTFMNILIWRKSIPTNTYSHRAKDSIPNISKYNACCIGSSWGLPTTNAVGTQHWSLHPSNWK